MNNGHKSLIYLVLLAISLVLISLLWLGAGRGSQVGSIHVTVWDTSYVAIPVSVGGTISIRPGGVYFLSLVMHSRGKDKAIPNTVWKTSDPQVARVEDNYLKGVKEGKAIISGSYQGQSASIEVLVSPVVSLVAEPASSNVEVEGGTFIMAKGTGANIRLNAVLADGVREHVSMVAKWRSLDPKIVAVVISGNMPTDPTLLSYEEGTAEVTATLDKLTTKIKVKVIPLTDKFSGTIPSLKQG